MNRSMMIAKNVPAPHQRGVTLVIALMFMVALTLLGVGMVRSTTSEERMSANTRDYDLAFASAEAALRDAEVRLQGVYAYPSTPIKNTNFPDTGCGTATSGSTSLKGLCKLPVDSPIPVNTTYTLNNTTYAVPLGTFTSTPTLQGVSTQPRYLIEPVTVPIYGSSAAAGTGAGSGMTAFRITSRGFGRRDTTQVQLQEVVLY